MDKTEISRKDLSAKLGGRKFSMRKVSFADLARDHSFRLEVKGVPDGIMSSEEYAANKDVLETIKKVKAEHTWQGKHIL